MNSSTNANLSAKVRRCARSGKHSRLPANLSTVVGAPHAQQLSTITVQVNPNAFPPQAFDIDDDTTGGARTAEMVKMAQKQEIQSDRCWRCPPYTPVFTTTAMKSRPADGTPLVMAHVPDGMNPVDAASSTWFRFVGVTLEDGAEDTTALKRHSRTGKCKFTVATKGCVTIACSPQNAREAQFVYGDPFCISLYQENIPTDERISGPSGKRAQQPVPTIRSTAFSGRLESDGHRTFVYSKQVCSPFASPLGATSGLLTASSSSGHPDWHFCETPRRGKWRRTFFAAFDLVWKGSMWGSYCDAAAPIFRTLSHSTEPPCASSSCCY